MIRQIARIAVFAAWAATTASYAPGHAATAPPTPVTGCMNQALSDGFWTLKVTKAALTVDPDNLPAWSVTFTFGNAQKKSVVPVEVGVGQPQIVLKDGTMLDMTTSSEIDYGRNMSNVSFGPGAQRSGTFWYRIGDATSAGVTFLFPVDPNNSVYHTPFGYPVKNPTFSVDLNCDRSASPKP